MFNFFKNRRAKQEAKLLEMVEKYRLLREQSVKQELGIDPDYVEFDGKEPNLESFLLAGYWSDCKDGFIQSPLEFHFRVNTDGTGVVVWERIFGGTTTQSFEYERLSVNSWKYRYTCEPGDEMLDDDSFMDQYEFSKEELQWVTETFELSQKLETESGKTFYGVTPFLGYRNIFKEF